MKIYIWKQRRILRTGGLVIRGLIICKFAYSHCENWSKITIFESKMDFLYENSELVVQNEGMYLQ